MGVRRTYASVFAVREFRTLFAGSCAQFAERTMTMLALSALVFAHTGSPLLAALALLAKTLPTLFGALTLLSWADRVPPRGFLVGWACVQALVAVTLGSGVLSVGGMLGLILVVGTGEAVAGAVRWALLADVVPDGSYVLARSVLGVAAGSMQIAGYALGGTLLVLVGPEAALYSAAALSLLGAVIHWLGLEGRPPRVSGSGSTLEATWKGNRTLLGAPVTRNLLLAQWLPSGLIVGAIALFVPYAGNSAGALFAAEAFGMLVGDLVYGRWVTPAWRDRLIVPLYVLLAVPFLAFPLHPPIWLAAALAGVAACGYASFLGLQQRYLDVVPDVMRGQALGLAGSGLLTLQGVSAVLAGVLAEAFGPAPAIGVMAGASLFTTAVLAPALLRKDGSKSDRKDGSGSDVPSGLRSLEN